LINAVSHITGGGLIENIPRMLGGRKHSLELGIGNSEWWNDLYLKCQNKMDMREFLTIFNGGYGMVLAVSPHNVDKLNIENVKVIGKVL
jgi:phosphoribosylformylglycinamidine cyclo-ligase